MDGQTDRRVVRVTHPTTHTLSTKLRLNSHSRVQLVRTIFGAPCSNKITQTIIKQIGELTSTHTNTEFRPILPEVVFYGVRCTNYDTGLEKRLDHCIRCSDVLEVRHRGCPFEAGHLMWIAGFSCTLEEPLSEILRASHHTFVSLGGKSSSRNHSLLDPESGK